MNMPLATIVTLKNNQNRGFINAQKFRHIMKNMGVRNIETVLRVDQSGISYRDKSLSELPDEFHSGKLLSKP